jgi:hypothetical protein
MFDRHNHLMLGRDKMFQLKICIDIDKSPPPAHESARREQPTLIDDRG